MIGTRIGKKILTGKTTLERIDNVRAYFIATRSRRWTNSHAHILRLCPEFRDHALQRRGGDLRKRAAPTRMNGGKGAGTGIANQDRYTVGRLYARQDPSCIADNRIAVDGIPAPILRRLRLAEVTYETHFGAVHLPATCERPVAPKELEKAATILQNVFRGVFVEAGQIE